MGQMVAHVEILECFSSLMTDCEEAGDSYSKLSENMDEFRLVLTVLLNLVSKLLPSGPTFVKYSAPMGPVL
jgi:hypothetical protein